eukprot:4640162-Prymnesium_polylepis.1
MRQVSMLADEAIIRALHALQQYTDKTLGSCLHTLQQFTGHTQLMKAMHPYVHRFDLHVVNGAATLLIAVTIAAIANVIVKRIVRAVTPDFPASKLRQMAGHERSLHALEGVLRRLILTPHRESLVLRGGLLLRHYCPRTPRQPADLDFLALHANDEELSLSMLRHVCGVKECADDGLEFDADGVTAIRHWTEMEHPALKMTVPYRLRGDESWSSLSIDLGWGDPLRPAPKAVHMSAVLGPPVRVCLAAQVETLFGWKVRARRLEPRPVQLVRTARERTRDDSCAARARTCSLHGLFEREAVGLSAKGVPKGYWRPKDLFDLYLMVEGGGLTPALLPPAVEIAFSSRGFPLSRLVRVAACRFASGPTSKRNWARWRADTLDALGQLLPPRDDVLAIPETPTEATAAIAPTVSEVLRALGYQPLPGDKDAVPLAPAWKVERVQQIVADARTRLVARPPPEPLPPRRDVSGTATVPEAYFVLGGANPIKWEESRK